MDMPSGNWFNTLLDDLQRGPTRKTKTAPKEQHPQDIDPSDAIIDVQAEVVEVKRYRLGEQVPLESLASDSIHRP